jgi:hypothetical protein
VSVFRYQSYSTDAGSGLLTCRYSLEEDKLGALEFTERVTLAPGAGWDTPQAQAAARLVFLLAGVSYYKTAAPAVIDLGRTALTALERDFLRDFYLQGLGEFAYRNNLDLSALEIRAPAASMAPTDQSPPESMAPPSRIGRCVGANAGREVRRDRGAGRRRRPARRPGGPGDRPAAAALC